MYHGGILFADRVEPRKPIHWVGLEVLAEQWDARRDRRRKAADVAYRERAEERVRRRAEREALSELGPDGFTLFDALPPLPVPASEPAAGDLGEPVAESAEAASDAAQAAPAAEPSEPARGDDDDVDGAVRPPADTPDRDADLAVETAAPETDAAVSEADALETERAREAEAFRNEEEVEGAYEEHQSRMDRQRQTEVDEYAAEEELLLGTVDEEALVDDPFDPGYGDEAEYEGAPDDGWNLVPPPEEAPKANADLPFGSAFKADPVDEAEAEADAAAGEGVAAPPQAGTQDPDDECPIPDPAAAHGHVATGRVAAEEDPATGSGLAADPTVDGLPPAAPEDGAERVGPGGGPVASPPPEAGSEERAEPAEASPASSVAVVDNAVEALPLAEAVAPAPVEEGTPAAGLQPGPAVVPEAQPGPPPSGAVAAGRSVEDEVAVGSGSDAGQRVAVVGGAGGAPHSELGSSALRAAADASDDDDAGGWSVPEDALPEDASPSPLGARDGGSGAEPVPPPVELRPTGGPAPGEGRSAASEPVDGVLRAPRSQTDDPVLNPYGRGDTGWQEDWERVVAGGPVLGRSSAPDTPGGARPAPAESGRPDLASVGPQTGSGYVPEHFGRARLALGFCRRSEPGSPS